MDNEHTNSPEDTAKQVEQATRLFDSYGSFIQSTLQYFVKDPLEQEELYQDLFLYFVRKPVPGDIQRTKSWLYRVVLDRIRDRKRRQSRYQKRLESYAEHRPDRMETCDSPPPNSGDMAIVFEQIRKHLSEQQAHAILYRYQDHLEDEEIARRMKVEPRTVTRYVSIGLKKLRMRLNKDE